MCEASAAVPVGCADGAECLLVADNEVRDSIFVFPFIEGRPDDSAGTTIGLDEEMEISDIEAVASLGSDRIVLFGSHSRNSTCDAKGSRRRFLVGAHADGEFRAEGELIQTKKIRCSRIFDEPEANPTIQAACATIDEAETLAEEIDARFDDSDGEEDAGARARAECAEAAPFNAEGAVTLQQEGETRVWVGLRAPLVQTPDGRRAAVLLRLKDLDEYVFDRVVLLDLGGRGVRELTADGDTVWGIAGPPADSSEEFRIWRMPTASLASADVVEPVIVAVAPTSSESLVIRDGRAHVLIDGDQGESGVSCASPVLYWSTVLEGE